MLTVVALLVMLLDTKELAVVIVTVVVLYCINTLVLVKDWIRMLEDYLVL